MAVHQWILCDVERNTHLGDVRLGPWGGSKGGQPVCSIEKQTLRGGLREGVEQIMLDNGRLRLAILPTRGMSLWKMWHGEIELGWKSPVLGPVNPMFVPLDEANGIGWLRGFDELLCRCGLTSNGAPQWDNQGRLQYPLHGRIANQPAHHLSATYDSSTQELTVTGRVNETRLFDQQLQLESTYRTTAGSPAVQIVDRVTNRGSQSATMQLLYHINIGSPWLRPGFRIAAPVKSLIPKDEIAAQGVQEWDIYPAQQSALPESVYFFELLADPRGRAHVLLHEESRRSGLSLRFDLSQLPLFVLWKNNQPSEDGYATGLEPAVNLPNQRSFEEQNGRVLTVNPGETKTFSMELELHDEMSRVEAAHAEIMKTQGATRPKIFDRPQSGWSPMGNG